MKENNSPKTKIWTYIKSYKFNSMFIKVFLIVFILFSIPFGVWSIMYYNNLKTATYQDIEKENTSLLYELRDLTDSIFSQCDSLCTYIANNTQTQMFTLNNGYNDKENINNFSNLIEALPLIYDYIDSIYVYSDINKMVFTSPDKISPINEFKDKGWIDSYKKIVQSRGQITARRKNDNYPMLITITKPIFLENEIIGAVIMNIDTRELCGSFIDNMNYNEGQKFFIINEFGQVYISNNTSYFLKNTSDIEYLKNFKNFEDVKIQRYQSGGETNLIAVDNSDKFPLYYLIVRSMGFYSEKLKSMVYQIFNIIVILILLSAVVAYFVAALSYRPVTEIISVLDNPEKYSTTGRNNKNEIRYIISNILKNIHSNEEMQTELKTRLGLLKEAQISMLQMQINPHFLYNTLDTIKWMSIDITGDENNVSKAIGNLARLYRTNVSTGDYLITLRDEMEQAKHYINILKLRYDDLFTVVWDIDEDALDCIVEKLCMQPIIENAVYHGLKPMRKGGVLTVRGCRADNKIAVIIQDNGIGIEDEDLIRLNKELKSNTFPDKKNGHIGIYNVNQRIKLIYGEKYGVFVSSEKGKGTIVRIIFPETYI